MNNNGSNYRELDLLRKLEDTTKELNDKLGQKTRPALIRYPITFGLLILFGIVAVNEGAKGLLEKVGFTDYPVYLLLAGLIVLVVTGTVYKKLIKK